jgi:hypothetical protein
MRAVLVALLVLVASFGAAHGGERTVEERARDHFESGRTLYRLGNYREALRQFTAGYELVKKPRLLINLAQTFRKLGDDASARQMIERYLAEAEPDDPARAQAKELLDELGPAPDAPGGPATPKPSTATVAPSAPPAAVVAPTPTREEWRRSVLRRWGWLIPVGVVAVIGISVGTYYGVSSATDPCRGATIGCVSANR